MAYFAATAPLTTAGLNHIPAAYYSKTALDQLLSKFMFKDACMEDTLPKRSGKVVQWYRYGVLGANTVAKTEGVIGSGAPVGGAAGQYNSATVTATVSQYADYIALSDFVRNIAIDDALASASKNLGYRAGLSVDKITAAVFDAATSASMDPVGTYFGGRDALKAWMTLQSLEVSPMDSGKAAGFMYGIISPLAAYDLINDPASGGFLDLYKYSDPSQFVKYEDRNRVATIHGCKFFMSNNVKVTTGTPDKYRTYIFGKDGVGCVSLAGTAPTDTNDVKVKPFSINVVEGKPSIADPEGVIGGICSYNFTYVAAILQSSPYRFRFFDTPSSIA